MSEEPLPNATPDVKATAVNDLWDRDPKDISDADILVVVNRLREARHKWKLEEQTSKKTGKRVNPSKGIKELEGGGETDLLDELTKDISLSLSTEDKK